MEITDANKDELKMLGIDTKKQDKGFMSKVVEKAKKSYCDGSTKFEILLTRHGLNIV